MNQIEQAPQPPPSLPLTIWERFLYCTFIIAAVLFNFSTVNLLGPEWQSGKFTDYMYLFLYPEASLWFFPLLSYSLICYFLLLIDENRFGKFFAVRLGVYTGMFLALQYSLLTLLTWQVSLISLAILAAWIMPALLPFAKNRINLSWNVSFLIFLFVVTVLVLALIFGLLLGNIGTPFALIALLIGMSAPFWSFLIALQASRWLWTHYESKFSLSRGLGIIAWLSAYAFALRFNILKMFELYNTLPTEPPNCYIATAAANGHPRFVGSQEVRLANGKTMRVNRQLQRLKALEIAWMGVSAPSHRMMRRVYDVIGKWLANHIQNPILADVAYFLLIPAEWISFFVLKLVIPEIQHLSERLYRS